MSKMCSQNSSQINNDKGFPDAEGGMGGRASCLGGTPPLSLAGILPLAKSSFGHGKSPSTSVFCWGDWVLPGSGEAYADCGSWRKRGCLEVDLHKQNGLEEDFANKVFIEVYRRSCMRAECPTCYESWASRDAHRIEDRLKVVGRKMGLVIHLTLSPSEKIVSMLPYEKLRAKAYSIAKKSGFRGGSCIFHPFRESESGLWVFSPHFHMIGYGWIEWTAEDYELSGWVVKNLGVRESVYATAFYQLSHCGISSKFDSVTWFGALAYNKLKIAVIHSEELHLCPICHKKLRAVLYVGSEKFEFKEGGAWLDAEGWIYTPRGDYG